MTEAGRTNVTNLLLAALAALAPWWPPAGAAARAGTAEEAAPQLRDTFSDTWVATDALGRSLPGLREAGPVRPDRWVGIFYFLWLGAHVTGGPHDVTRILGQHPDALTNASSPPWGPLHAAHHWGESVFGYYNTDDPYVLRKHAQMLSDAGVDTLIFDVTNQLTYRSNYLALLRVFTEVRRDGGRTPQVAFLCPFGDPAKVVGELFAELYEPGLYPALWFRWEGKPLILADPERLPEAETHSQHDAPARLEPGHTLGQTFRAVKPLAAAGGCFPNWNTAGAGLTMSLYRGAPGGERLAQRRFENAADNAWLTLSFTEPLPAGEYYLEISQPAGTIGWWSHSQDVFARGVAFADGHPAGGDRNLRLQSANEQAQRIRRFFTFRKPQPDYFRGPTGPDMWSWLEVHPQHVFTNSLGQKEQMSVGVAQNAVGGRLGSMSEPNAMGRSFRAGATDARPGAVNLGLNFAEQFERALREDPRFIFITGWNEWIAGRFNEFNGVRRPVMFVDEFDQEHSRDIEPMKGGHGDDYYYQMAAGIRRFKGVRPPPRASAPKTIRLGAGFAPWTSVAPEFRDDAGDTAPRDWPGYNQCAQYVNRAGRNDFVALKAARDDRFLYFYARTRAPITAVTDTNWMWLLIDADLDPSTGWEGYDFIVNRVTPDAGTSRLERNTGGWNWQPVATVKMVVAGNQIHLALPRKALGLAKGPRPLAFAFKWADNAPAARDLVDWLAAGDLAPNGRFRYLFAE